MPWKDAANWTAHPEDLTHALQFLLDQKSRVGNGGNFDKTVFNEAAKHMADKWPPVKIRLLSEPDGSPERSIKMKLRNMKSGRSPIGGPRQVLINGAGLASARALRPSLCPRPDFEK
ncbi:hypothetical protein B0H10DRAFT_1938527 [Mycena sp. CBHHK59/15]|nr:hypothetical protein B0H10DRAFT_1938527 [Mycena sp. CBHHK59/15]